MEHPVVPADFRGDTGIAQTTAVDLAFIAEWVVFGGDDMGGWQLDVRPPRLASIPDTADFTVRLVHRLQQDRDGDGRLLPEHVSLNVNYPAVDEPEGPVITRQGSAAFVSPGFEPADERVRGRVRVWLSGF